jgi:hypothetical protein
LTFLCFLNILGSSAGKGLLVSVELIIRLEELVDRLLNERAVLVQKNRALTSEFDRLAADRDRVTAELAKIIAKLDSLGGHGA